MLAPIQSLIERMERPLVERVQGPGGWANETSARKRSFAILILVQVAAGVALFGWLTDSAAFWLMGAGLWLVMAVFVGGLAKIIGCNDEACCESDRLGRSHRSDRVRCVPRLPGRFMRGRVAAVAVLVLISMVPTGRPALAWSNGEDGCNSFGTHDLRHPLSVGLLADSLRSAARWAPAALGAATSAVTRANESVDD